MSFFRRPILSRRKTYLPFQDCEIPLQPHVSTKCRVAVEIEAQSISPDEIKHALNLFDLPVHSAITIPDTIQGPVAAFAGREVTYVHVEFHNLMDVEDWFEERNVEIHHEYLAEAVPAKPTPIRLVQLVKAPKAV